MQIKLGMLCSVVRKEEKLLFREANKRSNINLVKVDTREFVYKFNRKYPWDVLLDRAISQSRSYQILQLLEKTSVPTINEFRTYLICRDKVNTSIILKKHGVPTPKFKVAFSPKAAKEAAKEAGYPTVIKPVHGSWGRMLALLKDRECTEAIINYKSYMNSRFQSVYYLQEFIKKPGRDIRAIMIGDELIGAAYRKSSHWITNASRGGKSQKCKPDKQLVKICKATSRAVGGGILAIDLLETKQGFSVIEVNPTMEFKEASKVIKEDIPARIIDYAVKKAR